MTEEKITCPLCGGAENVYKRTLSYGPRLLICSKCDLHFVFPYPTLGQEFYDQNYYHSWGMTNNVLPEHVKLLKEKNMQKHVSYLSQFVAKGNVLEVGCAMGSFLKVAYEEGFSVTGIDLSAQACDIAKKDVPGAKILQGTLETVKFKPGTFDIIFMSDLVEHVPDPSPFWKETTKILKNNGIICIITPDPRHWSCALGGNSWVHFKEEHLVFFSKITMDWVSRQFGLKLIKYNHIAKYTNFSYIAAQTRRFGPKPLEYGFSILSSILPKKYGEYLFPIPLGETRYLLRKSF
jgi:2-polyprenyl-3-methyl-5-hydroxy-6-metoxy-1,4-benzoquinol methylase